MKNSEMGPASTEKSEGCRCSVAVGFLLLLLVIAITVGMGIIVHFAQKDSAEFVYSVKIVDTGGLQGLQGCIDLARNNTEAVCSACSSKITSRPAKSSTRKTTPTTTASMTMKTTPSPTPTPAPTTTPLKYPFRLPGDLTPISYTLSFKPDFYQNNFRDFKLYGQSSIKVMCHKYTSEIIMHFSELNIANDSIIVRLDIDEENLFDSYEMYKPTEFIIIKTKTALARGHKYTIEFKYFSGPLGDIPLGIYHNEWWINHKSGYLATSSMYPKFARRAFPCFDEPAMKAVFDITIYRKEGQVAISNMPVMKTENSSDGWIRDTFQQTPKMSTYQVTIIVAQVTSTKAMYDNRFPISIWTHESQAASREYALNISLPLMKHFENYFGIDYSLPKLDKIVPGSDQPRQTENWGAQVYRESSLLYQEGRSDFNVKNEIAKHVSHRISHNWFGNLVTPTWWDDVWLIEAFTFYMQHTVLNVVLPERRPFESMWEDGYSYAMWADSKRTSSPVFGLESFDVFLTNSKVF